MSITPEVETTNKYTAEDEEFGYLVTLACHAMAEKNIAEYAVSVKLL